MPLRQCQCAYPGAVLETTVLAELSMLECLSKLETQVSWNSFLEILVSFFQKVKLLTIHWKEGSIGH